MQNARAILQDYLDRIGDAVMAGDFPSYAAGVALPFTLVTIEAEMRVTDIGGLRDGFDAYRRMLAAQDATEMERSVREVRVQVDASIWGHYRTDILSHGRRVFEPFGSDILIAVVDNRWQTLWISNDMRNAHWPIHIPFLPRARSALDEVR